MLFSCYFHFYIFTQLLICRSHGGVDPLREVRPRGLRAASRWKNTESGARSKDKPLLLLNAFDMFDSLLHIFYTPLPHVSSWEGSAKGIILDATNFGGCQATATIVRYCLCIITYYEHIYDFVIFKQGARLIHLGTFSEGVLLWHLCNIISQFFNFGTSSLAPHSSSSLRLVPFTHRHAANARLIPTAWFWIHLHEYYQKLACTWLYHGDLRLYKRRGNEGLCSRYYDSPQPRL